MTKDQPFAVLFSAVTAPLTVGLVLAALSVRDGEWTAAQTAAATTAGAGMAILLWCFMGTVGLPVHSALVRLNRTHWWDYLIVGATIGFLIPVLLGALHLLDVLKASDSSDDPVRGVALGIQFAPSGAEIAGFAALLFCALRTLVGGPIGAQRTPNPTSTTP